MTVNALTIEPPKVAVKLATFVTVVFCVKIVNDFVREPEGTTNDGAVAKATGLSLDTETTRPAGPALPFRVNVPSSLFPAQRVGKANVKS